MASEAITDDPMIGKVFDERYRIEEPLGQGGIGRVYKARHLILGRHVALKVLLAQYENVPVLQERFRREAEALAALSHPNIVTVTDFGVMEGMPYLVMELLEGQDLASLIDDEIIEPKRAFDIARQVLRALAYAHGRELVHRDLKPHNVFVRALGDGTDHVVVLDFVLARFMGDAESRGPKLTRAGALIGTPAYMAPEQASGEPVDERADLYAAGLLFFETLTGRKPFEAKEPGEMLRAHLLEPPPRIAEADPGLAIAEALEAWLARALAKSPAARFRSATEMLTVLDALGPDAARRMGPRPGRDEPIRGVEATQAAPTRPASPVALAQAPPEVESKGGGSRLPAVLIAVVGCAAALILLGGGVAFVVAFTRGGGEEEVAPPSAPTVVAPAPVAPAPPPELPTRAPPVDPFASELPSELRPLLARVNSGRELTRRQRTAVNTYNRANPDDPRGHLVLAHSYMNVRSLSWALGVYRTILPEHPELRGAPRVLPELLEIVRANDANLHEPASALVIDIYGEEAIDRVVEELQRHDLRPPERDRLLALDAQLQALGAAAP